MERLKHILSDAKFFIGTTVAVVVFLWTAFTYVYKIQNLPSRMDDVEQRMEIYAEEHQSIHEELSANRSYYDLTSAKLETTLLGIQSDIQLIKQIVMKKGLD